MNTQILYALNSLAGRTEFLNSLIVFLAQSLPWVLIIFTFIYFVFLRKNPKRFVLIFFCVGISYFVSEVLKWAIFRHPRPFAVLSDVVQLIQTSSYNSFPSTHATIFASLATVMFIYNKKLGSVFVFCAVLIGLARVAAGIHYPIDILTGFAIGFVITIIFYLSWRKISQSIIDFIS